MFKSKSFRLVSEEEAKKQREKLYEPPKCRWINYISIPVLIGFMLLLILVNVDFTGNAYATTSAISNSVTTESANLGDTLKINNTSNERFINVRDTITCANIFCIIICTGGNIKNLYDEIKSTIESCEMPLDVRLEFCKFYSGEMDANFFAGNYRLASLIITDCDLAEFEVNTFRQPSVTDLTDMTFIRTNIKNLNERTFLGLNSLKHFKMINNKILTTFNGVGFLEPISDTITEVVVQQLSDQNKKYDPTNWLASKKDQTELLKVDLSGNIFHDSLTSATFANLVEVQRLILSNCYITTIGFGTFDKIIKTLSYLDLSNNQLTTASGDFLASNSLARFHMELYDNAWNCDCEIYELLKFTRKPEIEFTVDPKCSTPDEFKDMNIKLITIDCDDKDDKVSTVEPIPPFTTEGAKTTTKTTQSTMSIKTTEPKTTETQTITVILQTTEFTDETTQYTESDPTDESDQTDETLGTTNETTPTLPTSMYLSTVSVTTTTDTTQFSTESTAPTDKAEETTRYTGPDSTDESDETSSTIETLETTYETTPGLPTTTYNISTPTILSTPRYSTSPTIPSYTITCEKTPTTYPILKKYDELFSIEPISSTCVRVILQKSVKNLNLIYFTPEAKYAHVFNTNSSEYIKDLATNVGYVFCLISNGEDEISPFNCRSQYLIVSPKEAWLLHCGSALFISLSILAVVICVICGIATVYWTLRWRPTWLKGNKRLMKVSLMSNEVFLLPKDEDERHSAEQQYIFRELARMHPSISDILPTPINCLDKNSCQYMQFYKNMELSRLHKAQYFPESLRPSNCTTERKTC